MQTELVDQAGRLASIGAERSGATLTGFAYTYEAAPSHAGTPLRASVTDAHTGQVTSYDYDGLDRLVDAVTRTSGGAVTDSHAYGYDAAGNRTSATVNGTTTTASFNAANQMTGQ